MSRAERHEHDAELPLGDLAYFTPSLRLRFDDHSLEDAPPSPLSHAVRIVLGTRTRLASISLARAAFSASKRLQRARLLLHHLECIETSSDDTLYQRCHRTVVAEWRWVARSSRARRVLEAEARRDGVDPALVREALRLIERELLPGLVLRRIHLLSAQRAPVSETVAAFGGLRAPGLALGLVPLLAHTLPALQGRKLNPSDIVYETVLVTLDREDLPNELRDLLLDRYAELMSTWLRNKPKWFLDTQPDAFFEHLLQHGAHVEQYGTTLALLDLRATILASWVASRHRIGVWRPARAAHLVAEALACSPMNDLACQCQAMMRAHYEHVVDLLDETESTPSARYLALDDLRRAMEEAFEDTNDGEYNELVEHRKRVLLHELAARLRLASPPDDGPPDIDALCEHLALLSARLRAGDDVEPAVEQSVLLFHPSLRSLVWDVLAEPLRQSVALGIEATTRALPTRMSADRFSSLAYKAFCLDDQPSTQDVRRTLRLSWMFSGTDAVFKLAAVVGLSLSIHAMVVGSHRRHTRERLEAEYTAAVSSVGNADDPATVTSTSAFLVTLEDREDPRREQVTRWHDEALVREVFRKAEAGELDSARALLEETSSATAPSDRGGDQ